MNFIYYIFYTLSKIVAHALFQYRVLHPERMIESGSLILAVNHQSYFDPPLAGICSKRAIYFLARKTLFTIPILGKLLPHFQVIPVDRDGNDRSALKKIIHRIREGHGVLLFPEGTRSPDGKLQQARSGLGLIIAKTKAPVLPIRIFGAHEAFPKNAKKIRLHPITVVLGKPIYFTETELTAPDGDDRALYQHLTERVMSAIEELQLPTS
jgi:1-acyl-sn-glycerol-3-phosphate acyltransferase